MSEEGRTTVQRIRSRVFPLRGPQGNYAGLLRHIGDARFVLIGESTHGTQEFAEARAAITRLLIEQYGFSAVAVAASVPDAYRLNRYVQGIGRDSSAREVLDSFNHFPSWTWRNSVVEGFIEWLREYNESQAAGDLKTGIYGLDFYNLNRSFDAVFSYLDEADAEAARRLRDRYNRTTYTVQDSQEDGYAGSTGLAPGLEKEVLARLVKIRTQAFQTLQRDGMIAGDEAFITGQSLRAADNAEAVYRIMLEDGVRFSNLRTRHMLHTLKALTAHLGQSGRPARFVVWVHNASAGDARATNLAHRGEISLGQLMRQHFPRDTVLIGQTTYAGSVSAAPVWGAPVEVIDLAPAPVGSFEGLFHSTGIPNFYLLLDTGAVQEEAADLDNEMLERLMGAVYNPQAGPLHYYCSARLMDQFNIVLHFDQTSPLASLEGDAGERTPAAALPETHPG